MNSSNIELRRRIDKEVIERVADKLHHTIAVCRRSYIVPKMRELFIEEPQIFRKTVIRNFKNKYGLSASSNAFRYYLRCLYSKC